MSDKSAVPERVYRVGSIIHMQALHKSVDMMFYVAPSKQGLAVFLKSSHAHH